MLSANISNAARKAIYRRDGFRCALCDSTKYLQVHHYCKRSLGGSDDPMNLITLCAECHGVIHGNLPPYAEGLGPEELEQACAEYLGDFYAPDWYPFK